MCVPMHNNIYICLCLIMIRLGLTCSAHTEFKAIWAQEQVDDEAKHLQERLLLHSALSLSLLKVWHCSGLGRHGLLGQAGRLLGLCCLHNCLEVLQGCLRTYRGP